MAVLTRSWPWNAASIKRGRFNPLFAILTRLAVLTRVAVLTRLAVERNRHEVQPF